MYQKEYRAIAEELIKVANQEAFINATAAKMLQQAERDAAVAEIEQDLEAKREVDRRIDTQDSPEED